MAYISFQPNDNFNTKIYTGNSGTQALTGVGFQPDLVWIKNRNDSNNQSHVLYDAVRGVTKYISSNSTGAEGTEAAGVTAFGTDGFTVGNTVTVNTGFNYVGWNWKGGTTSGITTNGSTTITPSSYSFNATAGIAILKFTGNSTGGAKLAHGLGGCDSFWIKRTASAGDDWRIYHKDIGGTHNLKLNSDDGDASGSNIFNDTVPDATNITLGSHNSANASDTMICYAFRGIKGFSKFGTYTGNALTNGPFIYTGFKPNFVMTKCSSHGSSNWVILDSTRDPYNVGRKRLYPNLSNAEDEADRIDFLSNGFKIRGDGNDTNGTSGGSGRKYLYWAFAEHPLVSSNGIPATAR